MDDQARWDKAFAQVLQAEIEAERKAALVVPRSADDDIIVTDAERKSILLAEAACIQEELDELSDVIDPEQQDREAHAILAEFGLLD